MFQRDAFFNRLYEIARKDRDVVLVVADMAAPALDKYRRDLPHQFVNVGIAEQNAILIASGLSLAGKKAYVYAIAPFIILRCLEQIRVSNGINEIPLTILGMGTGLGYEHDGPTHHLIEDIAIMRAIPGVRITSLTDSVMAKAYANITYQRGGVNYLRLEKEPFSPIYDESFDFSSGLAVFGDSSDYLLVSTGAMTHVAREVAEEIGGVGVIDVFEFPINESVFLDAVSKAKHIITLEEHFLPAGLGSAVCEVLNDRRAGVPVKRLGLKGDYENSHKYGGREVVRRHYGIGKDAVKQAVLETIGD